MMTTSTRTQCLVLHHFSDAEKEAICERLYALHNQVFRGVSYEAFRKYVVFSPAWRTWLYVRCTDNDEWVGYTALHAFRKTIQGEDSLIFRMETGTLPAYRGFDLTMMRVQLRMLAGLVRHWNWKKYLFSSFVHPSGYALAARYVPTLWPNAHTPTPPAYEELLYSLADEFGLAQVSAEHPMVREVNWITREATTPNWDPRRNPHVAYFLQENPTYGQGHGLLTVMPASIRTVLIAFKRFTVWRASKVLLGGKKVAIREVASPAI